MLVPTLWFVPAFTILISLGVWQIERLHWKLDLLARIKIGLSGKPVSIGDAYGDAVDYGTRDDHIAQADYRRVFLHGWFQNNQEIRFLRLAIKARPSITL
jgi:surfeit locus 1 family protein